MHRQVKEFCNQVKSLHPEMFKNKSVIDFGSYDINGTNRYLFTDCAYRGIDINPGPNVDCVCLAHKCPLCFGGVDVCISTEMLEHDKYWELSINKMTELLNEGGLLIITCATTGRKEHGTHNRLPKASPATLDHYKNVEEDEFFNVVKDKFHPHLLKIDRKRGDLYFYGFKKIEKRVTKNSI